ncbi:hypothetical protein QWY79_10180 [Halomonas sabkhae]|uniref:hypothetical protein n=1 Tax=Halomonas sabkhae TaxID=626223 RepID=UPI0025B400F2|nr:hypothetical protein [Halomonas sabkhae]MDN3525631.1 hypothetical protein [Halomonas sabkhae]
MPTWPATLPDCPDSPGYSEQPQSQVTRSQPEVGPAKTRRRSTAAPRTIPVTYGLITREQADTFEAFFENDIGAGALPFDWPQPRLGTTVSALIVGDPPYELTPVGNGKKWRLTMTLEIQP